MTLIETASLYTALYVLLGLFLTVRVIQFRFGKMISIGDGGSDVLARRVRAHGNFIENAPFMILCLFAIALLNGASLLLHGIAVIFLVGRILHAIGMVGSPANLPRQIGTVLSILSLLGAAIYILILVLT